MIQLRLSGVNHPRTPSGPLLIFRSWQQSVRSAECASDGHPYRRKCTILFKEPITFLNLKNTALERTTLNSLVARRKMAVAISC